MMIVKRSTIKIDSVYEDRDKAEKETQKKAGIKDNEVDKSNNKKTDGDE